MNAPDMERNNAMVFKEKEFVAIYSAIIIIYNKRLRQLTSNIGFNITEEFRIKPIGSLNDCSIMPGIII